MDITARIISEKVGSPETKRFEVSGLKDAISKPASEIRRKHVTLYPGDYTTWHQDTPFNQDEVVPIPEDVFVTLMPGAAVEYKDNYRNAEFQVDDGAGGKKTYDGSPIGDTGSQTHPLDTDSGPIAPRYKYPNFTRNVHNITDLNLASEWAFKQEFERSLWSAKGFDSDGDPVDIGIPFEGTVEYTGGNKVNIEVASLSSGAEVIVKHETFTDTAGDADDFVNGDFNNNGTARAIQSLTVDDGHVLDAETFRVVKRVFQPADDDYITLNKNSGEVQIGHKNAPANIETDTDVPTADSESDTSLQAGEDYSVGLRALDVDEKGHIVGIEYAPTVEEVRGGSNISVSELSPGDTGVFEVSLDNFDALTRNKTGEPADPAQGESVSWLSDGSGTGEDGDLMIKVNVGGTVKYGTLFDYSTA